MAQFGSHCLIIKDVNRFINAVLNKLKEKNIESCHGIVKYKKFNINNHNLTLFDKTHLLSYQKEHRILAWTENNEALKFQMGSLEDYAEIYLSKLILEKSKVEYLDSSFFKNQNNLTK